MSSETSTSRRWSVYIPMLAIAFFLAWRFLGWAAVVMVAVVAAISELSVWIALKQKDSEQRPEDEGQ